VQGKILQDILLLRAIKIARNNVLEKPLLCRIEAFKLLM
jgi:hypothetical protein